MATIPLSTEQHRHLVRLIAESAGILTPLDRQNLLDLAGLWAFRTRLTFDSDARTFAAQLVRSLQDHGTLAETGQPALVSLLRFVREIVAGNEPEAAFLDSLLAPYPMPGSDPSAPASVAPPTPASPGAAQYVTYVQNIYNQSSAPISQGPGATHVGQGGVAIGGNAEGSTIVTGDNNTVGSGAQSGGIRVGKIEGAEEVTIGAKVEGAGSAESLALAREFLHGNISVEQVLASRDVVVGLRHVSNVQQPTAAELAQEVAELRAQLAAALAAGQIDRGAAEEAAAELATAGSELAKSDPKGTSVVRRLRTAAEVLVEANEAAEAAQGLAGTLAKLAPYAATLVALARAAFGL